MWVLTPIGRLVKILTSHTDSRGLSLSLAARSRSEDFNSAMINRGLFVTIGYTLGIGEVAVRYLQSYLIFRDPKKNISKIQWKLTKIYLQATISGVHGYSLYVDISEYLMRYELWLWLTSETCCCHLLMSGKRDHDMSLTLTYLPGCPEECPQMCRCLLLKIPLIRKVWDWLLLHLQTKRN